MPTELSDLIEQLASQDWRIVGQAAGELLALGEAGMEAIFAGMTHPSPRIRRRCTGIMDHHGDDRCVINLTDRLLNDPIPYVRREAVHSLGCDRCKEAPLQADRVPLLIETLHSDPSIKVRREAAYGLSQKAPDPRVMQELWRILDEETDTHLRGAAHGALYHHDADYRAQCIANAWQRQIELKARAANP